MKWLIALYAAAIGYLIARFVDRVLLHRAIRLLETEANISGTRYR